jgi:hypothetical protein
MTFGPFTSKNLASGEGFTENVDITHWGREEWRRWRKMSKSYHGNDLPGARGQGGGDRKDRAGGGNSLGTGGKGEGEMSSERQGGNPDSPLSTRFFKDEI